MTILPPIGTDSETLRDAALSRLAVHRAALVRRIQRAYLSHLLHFGPDTSDAVRALVPIPDGIDPHVVGAAVRALVDAGLIASTGRAKSRRKESHARHLDLWDVRDRAAVER